VTGEDLGIRERLPEQSNIPELVKDPVPEPHIPDPEPLGQLPTLAEVTGRGLAGPTLTQETSRMKESYESYY
jgi:hypothetical protein